MKYNPLMPMWTGSEVVFANFQSGQIYRAKVGQKIDPDTQHPTFFVEWKADDSLVQPIFQDVRDLQDSLEPQMPEEVFQDALDTQKRLRHNKPPTFEGQPTCRRKE